MNNFECQLEMAKRCYNEKKQWLRVGWRNDIVVLTAISNLF